MSIAGECFKPNLLNSQSAIVTPYSGEKIMSLSIGTNQNRKNLQDRQTSKIQPSNVEFIQALTPVCLAAMGGALGIFVLVMHASEAGFGLASTAIAGAAGLAHPHKDQNRKDN